MRARDWLLPLIGLDVDGFRWRLVAVTAPGAARVRELVAEICDRYPAFVARSVLRR